MYYYREKYIIVSSTKGRTKKMNLNLINSFINHLTTQTYTTFINNNKQHTTFIDPKTQQHSSSQFYLFNPTTLILTQIQFINLPTYFKSNSKSSLHNIQLTPTQQPHIYTTTLNQLKFTLNTQNKTLHINLI